MTGVRFFVLPPGAFMIFSLSVNQSQFLRTISQSIKENHVII